MLMCGWCKLTNDTAARTTAITRRRCVMYLCPIWLFQMWTAQIVLDLYVASSLSVGIYVPSSPCTSRPMVLG